MATEDFDRRPFYFVLSGGNAPSAPASGAIRSLFFLNGFLFASWATRIPSVQSAYGLSNGQLGLALVLVAWGALVSMPLSGWLSSTLGSDKVSRFSSAIYLISFAAIALPSNLVILSVVLFCYGVGHGMLDVAMNAQAAELETRQGKPIMSSFHALWSIGGLSGALAGVLATAGGLCVGLHFAIAASLLGIAMLWISARLLAPSVSERAPCDVAEPHSLFRLGGKRLLLGTIAFCIMLGEGAMADWSAVFLHTGLGASESFAALGYAVFAITMATGRIFGDYTIERFGAVGHVRSSGVIAVGGLIAVVSSQTLPLALLGFAFIGLGFSTIIPAVFSAAGKLPGVTPSVGLATVSTIGYLGFLLGPPMIGMAAEWTNLRVALSLLIGTTLLAILFASSLRVTVAS